MTTPNTQICLKLYYLDDAIKEGLINDARDEDFIKHLGTYSVGVIDENASLKMRLDMLVESLEGTHMSYDDWIDEHPALENSVSRAIAQLCHTIH